VVNDCARKWPGLIADASLSGLRMACEPHHIIAQRASPKMIVSDNATAFTSNVILKQADDVHVKWHYIAPGKPQQNGLSKASTAS
jgi:putative transposase